MAKSALFERTAVSANGTKRTTQLHPRLSAIRVTANKGGLSWEMPRSLEHLPKRLNRGGSPAGTNRIQGSYWNGGQHGWRNRIRRICVGALLVRGKMALPSRKLRSNLVD